ncbi:MAG: glucose-1-phosphate cytidylyltransferase [Hyphomicrobiales bacterium]|nr:MAG: glucose-1-phosphate cytidylyltransferase [Hyphomicrobiales bacterium]
MKAVILAGGRGTRIAEESHLRPKPMVEIGGKPILWHIMKIYSHFGFNDFIICLGYRGYVIKEYFANYALHSAGVVTFDLREDRLEFSGERSEPWRITLVETGTETQTGGRIKRIEPLVKDDQAFFMTYGDGVANVDITGSLAFHKSQNKLATITTVAPMGRFGVVKTEGKRVTQFSEKPNSAETFINGGYFILSPQVVNYIDDDDTIWEKGPLERLAQQGQLNAFRHEGFWQPMDTLRERNMLEKMWEEGQAPWRVWQ